MGRKLFAVAAVAALLVATGCCASFAAERGKLHYMSDDNTPIIKVFIGNFTNESGNKVLVTQDIKKGLENAILNRKSVTFESVSNPADSEVQISGVIKKYQYMERGPTKITPSIGTMLLDVAATATQNYADILVTFTVTDTKTGKVLWQEDIYDYKKKVMTPKESVPIICNKVTRKFVGICFGK